MNAVTVRGLSRSQCAVLLACAAFEERGGSLGSFQISDIGRQICQELREAGFQFNAGEQEEIEASLAEVASVWEGTAP